MKCAACGTILLPDKRMNQLTRRESQVTALVIRAKTNQQISNDIGVSLSTVKTYLHSIYRKFEINSRIQLIYLWHEKRVDEVSREVILGFLKSEVLEISGD